MKSTQKKLITEIMEEDQKDGLYEQPDAEVDFSNSSQMAEDCWLFLTDDTTPGVAIIKKEAFLHEVRTMIESARQHALKHKVDNESIEPGVISECEKLITRLAAEGRIIELPEDQCLDLIKQWKR